MNKELSTICVLTLNGAPTGSLTHKPIPTIAADVVKYVQVRAAPDSVKDIVWLAIPGKNSISIMTTIVAGIATLPALATRSALKAAVVRLAGNHPASLFSQITATAADVVKYAQTTSAPRDNVKVIAWSKARVMAVAGLTF